MANFPIMYTAASGANYMFWNQLEYDGNRQSCRWMLVCVCVSAYDSEEKTVHHEEWPMIVTYLLLFLPLPEKLVSTPSDPNLLPCDFLLAFENVLHLHCTSLILPSQKTTSIHPKRDCKLNFVPGEQSFVITIEVRLITRKELTQIGWWNILWRKINYRKSDKGSVFTVACGVPSIASSSGQLWQNYILHKCLFARFRC